MFFPYKDDNPRVLFPFVTFGIIALNVLIFIGQFWISGNDPGIGNSLVYMYGFVPAESTHYFHIHVHAWWICSHYR